MKTLGATKVFVFVAIATIVLFSVTGTVSYELRTEATKEAERVATATVVSRSATATAHAGLVASLPPSTIDPHPNGSLIYDSGTTGFGQWSAGIPWTMRSDPDGSSYLVHSGDLTVGSAVLVAPRNARSAEYAVEATFNLHFEGYNTCTAVDDADRSFGIILRAAHASESHYIGVDCLGFAGFTQNVDFCCREGSPVPVFLDLLEHVYRVEYRANSIRLFIDGDLVLDESISSESEFGDAFGLWSDGVQLRVDRFAVYELDAA